MAIESKKSNVIPLLPPDLEEAERFLDLLDPQAKWFAFQFYWDPKGEPKPPRRERPKQLLVHGALDLVAPTLAQYNRNSWSVSVTVNHTDGVGRKLENITGVRAIKADFDDNPPPEKFPLEPSMIISTTPGRFHCYWLVKGTRMTLEMGKAIEEYLVREYDADPTCAEMARAMRLPGFYHMKEGPTMVRIVRASGRRYRPSQLRRAFPPVKPDAKTVSSAGGDGVSRALKCIPAEGYDTWINVGMALHDHFGGSDAGLAMWDEWSKTGSKYVVGECKSKWRSFGRVSGIRIATLFYIAREHGYKPDGIEDLNAEFAMTPMGIIHHRDGEDKFMKMGDFKNWTANRRTNGSDWLKDPNRRQYDRVVFCPGQVSTPNAYNLWQGWKVMSSEDGDCDLFLRHLEKNVCRGNKRHYKWLMSYFAEIFQRPMEKSGVSCVIQGLSGTGKTIVGHVFSLLLGTHYFLVDHVKDVTGRFNSIMASSLLMHADETAFATDKGDHGKLRSIISREHHLIEPKGFEKFRVPNYMRLLITAEDERVVNASLQERRFGILRVGDGARNDRDFFEAMLAQLRDGGLERLLFEMLHYPIVDLRQIPQTEGLIESKVRNLTAEQEWWHDCLVNGRIYGAAWAMRADRDKVLESYASAVNRGHDRATQTKLGLFLKNVVPDWGDHPRGKYAFPSLRTCIKHFEELTRVPIER